MNFELNEEQAMLRDSVRRWMANHYSFAQHQQIARLPQAFLHDHWKEMGELGWLGIALPEDVGGLGQSFIEASLIAEELGRGLALEPYVSVAALAANLILRAASPAQQAKWLPPLIAGEKIVVVAHNEHEARGELAFVETRGTQVGESWHLRGAKKLVFAAGTADLIIISARTSGQTSDAHGLSLFAVDPKTSGLVRRDYQTIDGRGASDLRFDEISVPADALIGCVGEAHEPLEYAHQCAITLSCAEAVGMMEHALLATRDYLTTRKQFGVAIGSFQALQHRAADMFIEVQVARAALWGALASLNSSPSKASRRAVATAKAQVGRAARFVCSQAIQLHGGIGVTEEYPIGHYFKRMNVFDLEYGNVHTHLLSIVREGFKVGNDGQSEETAMAGRVA
jgi:alkylation response protein AidB-like acyl-CoA dehydrogenase